MRPGLAQYLAGGLVATGKVGAVYRVAGHEEPATSVAGRKKKKPVVYASRSDSNKSL